MKDNFSKQSNLYSKFRPGYPAELVDFLVALVRSKDKSWDVGTGNGQFAVQLAEYFSKVYATDISAAQIENATSKPNIFYSVQKAEQSSFSENTFDLITIAQAIHWFEFDNFYTEAKRVLKPSGLIAALCYDIFSINEEIDFLVNDFYKNVTGPYWDDERKYVDEHYRSIPFPFQEIEAPSFKMNYNWKFENAIGYLNTWSAVQHYIKKNNENPVDAFSSQLKKAWGNTITRKVSFQIFMRVGKNEK